MLTNDKKIHLKKYLLNLIANFEQCPPKASAHVITRLFLAMVIAALMLIAPCALAEAATPADLEPMMPVLDSILRTTLEDASSYDPENSEYVWGVLYRLAVNYGLNYPEASIDEETYDYIVPAPLMQSFAASAFPTLQSIPAPSGGTTYDAASDSYRLPGSDRSEDSTSITGVSEREDGATIANIEMTGESMTVALTPALETALFPYVVMSVD